MAIPHVWALPLRRRWRYYIGGSDACERYEAERRERIVQRWRARHLRHLIEQIDAVLSDSYCWRCHSSVGTHPNEPIHRTRPDWCDVCWDTRRPPNDSIQTLLKMVLKNAKTELQGGSNEAHPDA